MDIKKYLSPIYVERFGYSPSEYTDTLGTHVLAYTTDTGFPCPSKGGLVLVGVGEDSGAEHNAGCGDAPDEIRRYLYRLAVPDDGMTMYDLGNIELGQTAADTYYALSEVVAAMLELDCTLIVLGGSQDLTFAMYKGYETLNRVLNIAEIDPRFDMEDNDEITSRTWLKNIVMQSPNYLFFNANIGYQTYFVGHSYVQLMDDLKFDSYRLGEVQRDMTRAETLIRNADLVSVDIAAIRQSDAPGNGRPSPHGFYGEEFCQMMRYAGMSDKTSCLGIFELNPLYDECGQTANMVAQGLWYFIEGFYGRQNDNPLVNIENCRHFIVKMEDPDIEIDFYKSKLSDRWWVKVPCQKKELQELYSSHIMLPCVYADYQQAMQGEVPSLWWRYFQRLN